MTRRTAVCMMFTLFVAAGCGGGASEKSFMPAHPSARESLTAALDAWKGGTAKPGTIESTTPAVRVADVAWDSGARLTGYEIVKAHEESEGPSRFSVKLSIEGEAAPIEIVYVVVGKDPIWVMREDEYNRTSDM